ncbi:hypothetical protein C2869_09685 [Saccharobesus litoralis]|uniref:SMODS and SLOG-associating 2TM effector domain-containing protein n=1 Tax=Saccharobesus litoralis TaxID=2172099 RepID=A0A2S0VR60_9ALTE|nr:hypothetical protein C2869_09685 [Saccharobesus litoralis]
MIDEIDKSINKSLKHARKNYYYSSVLIVTSILASFLTAIAVADGTELFSKFQMALFAAIPGTAITLSSRMKFEEKCKWYYKKFHDISALKRDIEYNNFPKEEASKKLSLILSQSEKLYPGFGSND